MTLVLLVDKQTKFLNMVAEMALVSQGHVCTKESSPVTDLHLSMTALVSSSTVVWRLGLLRKGYLTKDDKKTC